MYEIRQCYRLLSYSITVNLAGKFTPIKKEKYKTVKIIMYNKVLFTSKMIFYNSTEIKTYQHLGFSPKIKSV